MHNYIHACIPQIAIGEGGGAEYVPANFSVVRYQVPLPYYNGFLCVLCVFSPLPLLPRSSSSSSLCSSPGHVQFRFKPAGKVRLTFLANCIQYGRLRWRSRDGVTGKRKGAILTCDRTLPDVHYPSIISFLDFRTRILSHPPPLSLSKEKERCKCCSVHGRNLIAL